jgi:hypothetical protein
LWSPGLQAIWARLVVNAFLEENGTVCALDHRQGRLAKIFPVQASDCIFMKGLIARIGQQ